MADKTDKTTADDDIPAVRFNCSKNQIDYLTLIIESAPVPPDVWIAEVGLSIAAEFDKLSAYDDDSRIISASVAVKRAAAFVKKIRA